MKVIQRFWQNFKMQQDVWFFYGFLLTFTLSVRKVLFFYPINGKFNEYTGIYLYLSDIFLILALISWAITIFEHNFRFLSIYKRLYNSLNKPFIFLPLVFVAWSFISVFWSQNIELAIFRSLKLLEFYLLYLYVIYRLSIIDKNYFTHVFKIIIILGFIQAIIGIFQFIFQYSIGLFWLKESLISADLPGVAKIILNGHKFIRAYGLFPHPNILGGFLVLSIMVSLAYKKMFHIEHTRIFHSGLDPESSKLNKEILNQVQDDNEKCSTSNIKNCSTWNINYSKILPIFIFTLFVGLILTFSKSAILGFTIALTFIYFKRKIKVPCGTLAKRVAVISLIVILAFFLIKPDIYSFFINSLNERILYLDVSRGTITNHLLFGIGIGQFVSEMQNYPKSALEAWQYQPVHNVFLLIWAEMGFVGLFIFVYWLWKLFHPRRNVPCGTFYGARMEQKYKNCHSERSELANKVEESNPIRSLDRARDDIKVYIEAILFAFIFIMLFDHYFCDIQQGQIILWMALGLVAGSNLDCCSKKQQ